MVRWKLDSPVPAAVVSHPSPLLPVPSRLQSYLLRCGGILSETGKFSLNDFFFLLDTSGGFLPCG